MITKRRLIMDTMRFDRREDMTIGTVKEIMDIINDKERVSESIKNSLFGLLDGYLYSDLLPKSKETLSAICQIELKR